MNSRFADHGDTLEITSRMGLSSRIMTTLIALVPLLVPYELLLKVGSFTVWRPNFFLAVSISACAFALCLFLLIAALSALDCHTTIDATTGMLSSTQTAPIATAQTYLAPVSSIESVQIARKITNETLSYALILALAGGRSLEVASSFGLEEIERYQARLNDFLGRHSARS